MSKIFLKENGVTLVALVITIIVLLIIAGVSIVYGLSTLNEVKDERTETELSMVQQAIIQVYTLLLSEEKDGVIAETKDSNTELGDDTSRPDNLIGTRIVTLTTLTGYGFTEYVNDYSDTSTMCYEDYYYLLTSDDLVTLGVEKESDLSESSASRSYIVNYSTGEVFDIVNKTYTVSEDEIYLKGIGSKEEDSTEETEYKYDFSDNTTN